MNQKILNKKLSYAKAGLSSTTAWRLENAGLFPARRQLSPGRVGYVESEIEEWILSRQQVPMIAGKIRARVDK